jgi:hypothetical protein
VSGNDITPIFIVSSGNLTLKNITIAHGYNANQNGGAIENDATLTIDRCKFLQNATASPYSGGAIVSYGPLTISNTEFGATRAAMVVRFFRAFPTP